MRLRARMREALGALLRLPLAAAALACVLTCSQAFAAAPDSGSFDVRMAPTDIWPPAPVTDLAGTAGAEGQALLQWTAPHESTGVFAKSVPNASYIVKVATFSAAALGGDTTAWFNAAALVPTAPPPLLAGSQQALLTSLEGGVTYYFGLKAVDNAALVSDTDAQLKGVATQVKVPVKGIAGVTDLTAVTGPASGDVSLTWTHPRRVSAQAPLYYEMRVSSTAQIKNNADFAAAQPLTAFSSSALPVPAGEGALAQMTVTGLIPQTTYYFAVRMRDNGGFTGVWQRNPAPGFNPDNWAPAHLILGTPDAITDLTALATGVAGQVQLSWTAPRNSNFVPISTYTVRYNVVSISDLAGDTTAWFDLGDSTTVVVSPAKAPGSRETVVLNGFPQTQTFFFAIKSTDATGMVSPIDTRADGGFTQTRIQLGKTVIPLTALPGAQSGSIELSWTEPLTNGLIAPFVYEVRASTQGNFDDNLGFLAAQALTALSPSEQPSFVSVGSARTMQVTSLIPGVTYYFGIRMRDSAPIPVVTDWRRDVSAGVNPNNFAPAHFIPALPNRVTDLTALAGAAEGEITLSWTAPRNLNFVPMAGYQVRASSISVAAVGNEETWFGMAQLALDKVPALGAGVLESLTLSGLNPNTTFYIGVKAYDHKGEVSLIDLRAIGPQAWAKPSNFAPAAPSGLTAFAGLRRALVSWGGLSAAQKGLDFAGYRLYRSTEQAAGFTRVASSDVVTLVDRPLTAFATFYYKLSSYDQGGYESPLTSTVSVVPFTILPMEPIGYRMSSTTSTVTFGWSRVTRFADGTLFDNALSPSADELLGYSVRRSTSICQPLFTWLSTAAVSASSHTDTHNGAVYFYQIKSYNSLGLSSATLVLSSVGEYHYFLDDCASKVVLDEAQQSSLRADVNGLGADIQLLQQRRPSEVGGGTLQSVEFRPMLDGVTPLDTFHLAKPARVTLHYETAAGVPVPDTTPLGLGTQAVRPAGGYTPEAAAAAQNLGMYWNNGAEFKKLYGTVDPLSQTVSVQTPNLGRFQIRTLLRQGSAVFDLSNLSSRVITPNGDGLNDTLIFTYDPGPNNVLPTGGLYDLKGGFVSHMVPGLVPNTLTWDGKMNGKAVTSGVYVYEIKGDGKTFTGTIVIAR